MNDPCANVATPLEDRLDALAAVASALEPPAPHERRHVLRSEAGILLDRLLTRCARGRGALDVAIGEGLAALGTGDRVLRLSYSGIGDYAREALGIPASTAQKMVRLARELRDRPVLRDAVWVGEVTARKAEVVLPVARGEAEESWAAHARTETVRALQAAVKAAGGSAPEEDEQWERVCVLVSPEVRPVLDEALALAGKLLGPTAPKWQRLEAMCEEFLGAHAPGDDGVPDGVLRARVEEWLEPLKEWLEEQTEQWNFLDRVEPVAAPVPSEPAEADLSLLDAELRRLAGLRDRWDEVFGHLAMLFRILALWRDAQFASFAHYCAERLGMGARTVEQRIALERRLYELPALRRAMREGRISYEKARLVAWRADDKTVEEWIGRAARMTCIELRHEVEADEEAQMCARGDFELRVPRRVGVLLGAAMRAARNAAGKWITPGECLRRIVQHFIDTWGPALRERSTPQRKVLARDRGLCQVPGCSRAAAHVHHIVYRSQGGADDPANLVSLCAAHHLHGVHMGWVRVRGEAPDRLQWELGVQSVQPP